MQAPPPQPTLAAAPVPTVAELVARCQELPSPPGLTLQIVRQAEDERTTVSTLARTIGRDAGLASALVRMANSSMFSPTAEIASIERAVAMLGLRSVTLMALSLSVGSLLPGSRGVGPLTVSVRRRSLVNAVLSRRFVRVQVGHLADEVFLAGLLGHLGRLGVAEAAPEAWAELVRRGGGWSRPEDELAVLGTTGDELTAELLARWGLPARLVEAVRHRWAAGDAACPPGSTAAVGALRLGLLAEAVLCGPEPGPALQELRRQALARLGMGAAELDRLLLDAEPVLAETAHLLGVELPPGTSHEELLARAVVHIAALSADTAAELNLGRRRTAELTDENQRLSSQSRQDPLTGLANRRPFEEFLHRHLAAPAEPQRGGALGLLVIDLDHFKHVNDTYGHPVGDQVLQAVASLLARSTRRDDLAVRLGGEEFVVVLPHTGPAGAARAADRLRRAIADLPIPTRRGTLRVTASIGGACTAHGSGPEAALALIERADAELYKAKRAGRDTCRIDPASP